MAQKNSTEKNEAARRRVASLRHPAFTRLNHDSATIEEFDRERMGVAAKE